RRAAMQVHDVPQAAIIRGNYIRLAVHAEANVAHEAGVENGVHRFAVIFAPLWQPFNLSTFGGGEVAHALYFSGLPGLRQCQLGPLQAARVFAQKATAAGRARQRPSSRLHGRSCGIPCSANWRGPCSTASSWRAPESLVLSRPDRPERPTAASAPARANP